MWMPERREFDETGGHLMTGQWPHQVEMKIAPQEAGERLRRIEGWCADWQISFRVREPEATGTLIRIAFEDARFARAFHSHFGGVIVPLDEIERAMAADAVEEDEYDRLAAEFPETE
jgi:hypothetical protein